ncbi:MAG: hypothetical protein PWR01_4529 [Clostridiales bacterium]|jgi:hypothetical protein|nr:hypothetical protein [Clostridiales bacterium]MDN5283456.1 hypothetical protein [Candidatus Ozemobacter sp.]
MTHQIKDFTDNETKNLAKNIQTGKKIVSQLSKNEKITAKNLDEAFSNWARQDNEKEFSGEDIANGLGSLFGELIKTDFSFTWKMIEDDLGTEAALVDDTTGSILFPINSVWKRIEPKILQEPFFEPMWKAIKAHIEKQKGS